MAGVLKRARDLFGTPAAEETKLEAPKRPARPWHAVSIVPGHQSCAAAAGLVRKHCRCRYDHHNDRRKGPRRASEMGVSVDGYEGVDKRGGPKRGRRKTDRR